MAKTQLKVKGLHCGGCVKRLHRALTSVAGVSTAEVILEGGAVTVEYDAAKVTEPALKTVVVDTGFEVIAA